MAGKRVGVAWAGLGLLVLAGCSGTDEAVVISEPGVGAERPEVAAQGDAGFVALWRSSGPNTRLFDAEGAPLGPVMPLATVPVSLGHRMAADAAGRYVVVWQRRGTGEHRDDPVVVEAMTFAADGTPISAVIPVGTLRANRPSAVAVDMTDSGHFVVAWLDPVDGTLGNCLTTPTVKLYTNVVRARRFSLIGTPLSGEQLVASDLLDIIPDGGCRPIVPAIDVAVADGVDPVVVWRNPGSLTGSSHIKLRRLARATTQGTGLKRRLDPLLDTTAHQPRVDMNASGQAVVVWQGDKALARQRGVFAQVVGADGANVGARIEVAVSELAGTRHRPSVAVAPDGGFAVVWAGEDDPQVPAGADAIQLRQFDAQGQPLGPAEWVGPAEAPVGTLVYPDIALAPGGGMAVVWNAMDELNPSQSGILARLYPIEQVD